MFAVSSWGVTLAIAAASSAQIGAITLTLDTNPPPITQELAEYVAARPIILSNLVGFRQGDGLNQYTGFSFIYRTMDEAL